MLIYYCGVHYYHCCHYHHHPRCYHYLSNDSFHWSPTPFLSCFCTRVELWQSNCFHWYLAPTPYSSRGLYQDSTYCWSFKQFTFWEGQLDVEAKQGQGERIFSLLHPGDKVKYSSFRRRSSKRNNVDLYSSVIQNKSDRLTLNSLPSHTDSAILCVNSLSPTVHLERKGLYY